MKTNEVNKEISYETLLVTFGEGIGRLNTMFDDPQVEAEDIIAPIAHPVLGSYRGVTRSIQFSRTAGPDPFAAPTLDLGD